MPYRAVEILVPAVIDALPGFDGRRIFPPTYLFRMLFFLKVFFGVEKLCLVGNVDGFCSDRYIFQEVFAAIFFRSGGFLERLIYWRFFRLACNGFRE